MNQINSGKHQVSFEWYVGNSTDSVKITGFVPPTIVEPYPSITSTDILPSQTTDQSRSIGQASSPSNFMPIQPSLTPNEPLPELPSTTHSLLEPVHSQEFNAPPLDQVEMPREYKEPSRIRRSLPISTSSPAHVAYKHPHPTDRFSKDAELPLKRVKIEDESSHDALEDDFRDYNTIAGSDIIDFKFSSRTPSKIIAMEEVERLSRRQDPVLSGKFYRIQQEFMLKVNMPSLNTTALASGLSDSLSNLKSSIVEKGSNLMDSTKGIIRNINVNAHPLRSTLNDIAVESNKDWTFRPLNLGGDKIEFVWPRIPDSIKAAEEKARSERSSGISPFLYGKWKIINSELKTKWNSPGFVSKSALKSASLLHSAEILVEKAAHTLNDAVHYTTEKIGNLSLRAQEAEYDLNWVNLQEEKERARRINEDSLLDPKVDACKAELERQLLKTVNALNPVSQI